MNNEAYEEITVVWEALHDYREKSIATDDETWDRICGAMAYIQEQLGCEEVTNGS